ncbi:MAG: thioredoxin [Clostridia bacterium]|nr:thioredoxin [Clostridia bacterium]
MTMAEIIITDENFEKEVLQSDIPVLVDFWAGWCGPCKMLAPIIAQIAQEQEGKIKVCKADVDECMDIAGEYGVASIPTVILFKDGKEAERSVGFKPKEALEEMFS